MTPLPFSSRIPRSSARFVALALPSLLVSLGGCVDANNRLSLGAGDQQLQLDSLTNAQPLAGVDGNPPSDDVFNRPDDVPTTTSIDRSSWDRQTVLVPVDYTLHRPHYRIPWSATDKTHRERNEFPTALTALEMEHMSANQQSLEGAIAPIFAFVELAAIPFRLITEPQCLEWRSPDVGYGRMPSSPTPAEAQTAAEADVPQEAPPADAPQESPK